MLESSTEQRRLLADKVLDLANVGADALVFGQALGAHEFSIGLALLGTGWWPAGLGAPMLLGWKGRR